jgi:hypothetical protein
MLKPQDVVLLLKLLAHPEHLKWSQAHMAMHLCVSVSEINAGIKRLISAGLLQIAHPVLVNLAGIEKRMQSKQQMDRLYQPVLEACKEFIISGVKYMFPAQLGEMTAGVVTSYASHVMKGYTTLGNDPVPVWPYAGGHQRGMSLAPLYSSVPKSIDQFPDTQFYELLCLVDVLRQGNCREYVKAVELLKERIKA